MEFEFIAPGPGTWSLDTTHNAAAMTCYAGECFGGLPRGFEYGCNRYGLLMAKLQPAFMHGFFYVQQVGLLGKPGGSPPPKFVLKLMSRIHPVMRKRVKVAQDAFARRLWLEDLKQWDEMKQDSIARNTALQSVDLSSLDDAGLIAHLKACRANAEEMVYRHHIFTIGAMMPVGWLLDVATRSSGLTASQVAPLLKGSTPVSVGIAGPELAALVVSIRAAGITAESLQAQSPEAALAQLQAIPEVASALKAYLAITGHMLIGGYCISEKTVQESPNIIIARILEAFAPREAEDFDKSLQESIRNKIAASDREEFDQALADARLINRMRDERGVYNDIWGAGISRTAILEAGRRLQARGTLSLAELALDATSDELNALMRDEDAVSDAELQARREWRLTKSIDEIPLFLGDEPTPPPPLDLLPAGIQPTMRAFAAVMGNVFDSPDEPEADSIKGLPVSPGVYEGTAKVIRTTRDFGRLEQGDVLVTKNTSAGFNVVLPLIGALVTDRGGLLSHAAIVSREYGIPGVIGTKNSTLLIPDGARVRVDGDKGEVTVL